MIKVSYALTTRPRRRFKGVNRRAVNTLLNHVTSGTRSCVEPCHRWNRVTSGSWFSSKLLFHYTYKKIFSVICLKSVSQLDMAVSSQKRPKSVSDTDYLFLVACLHIIINCETGMVAYTNQRESISKPRLSTGSSPVWNGTPWRSNIRLC